MDQNAHNIPVGTPVIALDGERLGTVREVHKRYLLIDQEGEHDDLDLPVRAIDRLLDGELHISLNRTALTRVDHEETIHHDRVDDGGNG